MSRWELFIISAIGAIACMLAVTIQEIREVRMYFEFYGNEPNISSQYAYVKDFMDRNVEYFSVFTGVSVAVISTLVALTLFYNVNGKINEIKTIVNNKVGDIDTKASAFMENQSVRNNNHIENFEKLKSENALAMTNIYIMASRIASDNKEYKRTSAFLKKALSQSVRVTKDMMPSGWQNIILNDLDESIIAIETIGIVFEPIEPMSLNEIAELINKLPDSLRNRATEILMKFLITE